MALVFLAGLVVADVVTLTKAKPSFVHETRDVENLIKSTTTTTVPPRRTTGIISPISTAPTAPTASTTSTDVLRQPPPPRVSRPHA